MFSSADVIAVPIVDDRMSVTSENGLVVDCGLSVIT